MLKFGKVIGLAIGVVALFVAPPSVSVEKQQPTAQTSKRPAADKKQHRLVLQMNTNDPAMMNLVLNNATNVAEY